MNREEYSKQRFEYQAKLQEYRSEYRTMTEVLRDSRSTLYKLGKEINATELEIFRMLYEKRSLVFPFFHTSKTRVDSVMRDIKLSSKINDLQRFRSSYDRQSNDIVSLDNKIHHCNELTMSLITVMENLDKECHKSLNQEEKDRGVMVETLLSARDNKYQVDVIYSSGRIVTVSDKFESIESALEWLTTNAPNIAVRRDNKLVNKTLLEILDEVRSIHQTVEDPDNKNARQRKAAIKENILVALEALEGKIIALLK
jgi:hypothetical protein